MTAAQREAVRVARLAIGRTTQPNNRVIEYASVDPFHPTAIVVRFAGSGLAPFREATYSAKEVLRMIGAK